MRATASAYVALGLEPGADRTAVEEAYRRLIKLHHPDRSGGDARRAAEINRAYFELRHQHAPDPSPAHPQTEARAAPRRRSRSGRTRPRSGRRRRSPVWPVLAIGLAALLLLDGGRLLEQAPRWMGSLADLGAPVLASGGVGAARIDSSAIDGPLEEPAIADSIHQAIRLVSRGDEEALAQQSRDCHRRMRSRPNLAQLDRCAAFDDAVAAVADREPSTDRGTFSASAVTARKMTAASLLSSDYLAIGRRLDRIRTMVELTVRPRPSPLPPLSVAGDEPLNAPVSSEAEPAPDGIQR